MAVVFPFEVELYEKAGGKVVFVGHPLLEVLESRQTRADFCAVAGLDPDRPIIGMLPGSRIMEVERMLPAMVGTLQDGPAGPARCPGRHRTRAHRLPVRPGGVSRGERGPG